MADRNEKGQFNKGHKPVGKPSPGRPKRKTEEKYLKWMIARIKRADWDTIVDAAISRAMSGDNAARQWLSDYLMGRPKQQVAVEGEVGLAIPSVIEVNVQSTVGDRKRETDGEPSPGPE